MCIRLSDPAFQSNYEISIGIITSLTLNKEFSFFYVAYCISGARGGYIV